MFSFNRTAKERFFESKKNFSLSAEKGKRKILAVLLAEIAGYLSRRIPMSLDSVPKRNGTAKLRKRPISKHNQRTQLIIIAICYQSQVYANITGVKSRIIVFHSARGGFSRPLTGILFFFFFFLCTHLDTESERRYFPRTLILLTLGEENNSWRL